MRNMKTYAWVPSRMVFVILIMHSPSCITRYFQHRGTGRGSQRMGTQLGTYWEHPQGFGRASRERVENLSKNACGERRRGSCVELCWQGERLGNGEGTGGDRRGRDLSREGSDEGFESSFPGVRRRRRLNPATRAIRLPPIIRNAPYSSSRGDGLSSNPKDDICTHRCQLWYLLVVPPTGV